MTKFAEVHKMLRQVRKNRYSRQTIRARKRKRRLEMARRIILKKKE